MRPHGPPANDSKKKIFLRWEKWRIAFNLILLVESLCLLWGRIATAFADSFFMSYVVLFAVAANVCYCLGPLIDSSDLWTVGSPRTDRTHYRPFYVGVRYFLFWAGLGISMLLVYILVIHSLDYLDGYQ